MIRWWPPIAVAAMALLGWAVGTSSTPLDDWFHEFGHTPARHLTEIVSPLVLTAFMLIVLGVALYRRCWRFAAVVVVFPPASYVVVQLMKPLFGRLKDGALAYPSGHITLTTVVAGLFVLAVGGALWAASIAVGYVALAAIGVGATYHYVTDTVGAVLLGTAIVGIAALVAESDLTRVNPDAIYVTRGG